MSNAQDLAEEWRPEADQDFTVYMRYLGYEEKFILHAAGQPFTGALRAILERTIRRSLSRINHPESLARLLARAVRTVAANNPLVSSNVMCTLVRRAKVTFTGASFIG